VLGLGKGPTLRGNWARILGGLYLLPKRQRSGRLVWKSRGSTVSCFQRGGKTREEAPEFLDKVYKNARKIWGETKIGPARGRGVPRMRGVIRSASPRTAIKKSELGDRGKISPTRPDKSPKKTQGRRHGMRGRPDKRSSLTDEKRTDGNHLLSEPSESTLGHPRQNLELGQENPGTSAMSARCTLLPRKAEYLGRRRIREGRN